MRPAEPGGGPEDEAARISEVMSETGCVPVFLPFYRFAQRVADGEAGAEEVSLMAAVFGFARERGHLDLFVDRVGGGA